ncbi:MAG: hypothetical protein ABF289_12285 [Clostridiales bacterium]
MLKLTKIGLEKLGSMRLDKVPGNVFLPSSRKEQLNIIIAC